MCSKCGDHPAWGLFAWCAVCVQTHGEAPLAKGVDAPRLRMAEVHTDLAGIRAELGPDETGMAQRVTQLSDGLVRIEEEFSPEGAATVFHQQVNVATPLATALFDVLQAQGRYLRYLQEEVPSWVQTERGWSAEAARNIDARIATELDRSEQRKKEFRAGIKNMLSLPEQDLLVVFRGLTEEDD